MGDVIQIPLRCEADVEVGQRCKSRNALWVDTAQMALCLVHSAAHEQRLASKRRHPAKGTP